MHVCLDVGYRHRSATVACVTFADWTDPAPSFSTTERFERVHDYIPGQFYRRELPCLLAVLGKLQDPPQTIVVDGQVHLDDSGRAGLGLRLFDELKGAVPFIGVAKSAFHALTKAVCIHRGNSSRPLYVTAAGVLCDEAAGCIRQMHGPFRIPTMLRLVDELSRGGPQA